MYIYLIYNIQMYIIYHIYKVGVQMPLWSREELHLGKTHKTYTRFGACPKEFWFIYIHIYTWSWIIYIHIYMLCIYHMYT